MGCRAALSTLKPSMPGKEAGLHLEPVSVFLPSRSRRRDGDWDLRAPDRDST